MLLNNIVETLVHISRNQETTNNYHDGNDKEVTNGKISCQEEWNDVVFTNSIPKESKEVKVLED